MPLIRFANRGFYTLYIFWANCMIHPQSILKVVVAWQEIIQSYHIKHYNLIAKTTKSLCSHFGITCVDYLKIYNDGKFIYLTSRPDCAEYYADQGLYDTDLYFRHPDTHQSGLVLLENHDLGKFQNHVNAISSKFNIYSPVISTTKGLNFVELFCFSGKNPQVLQVLTFQYSKLINHYFRYFNEELFSVMKSMEEDSFSLKAIGEKN